MEKNPRTYSLSLFLGTLSLLLSVVAVIVCIAAYRTMQPTSTNALAVSGTAENDDPSVAPPHSEVILQPSPSEDEQDAVEPLPDSPAYTVRLVPTDTQNTAAVGIYDDAGALVLQVPVPLATLMPSDKDALQAGIVAKDLESARQLIRDYCG